MARAENTELIDRFEEFYRSYYRNEIGELAQKYPNEQKSLYVDWQDLYRFDPDIADDVRNKPEQLREYAEEALRLYDLPVDVSLGQAHVRLHNLPQTTDIREIRADQRGMLIEVQGIVRKATDVRPKIVTAAFECQRCGTLTRIPQAGGDFQEPHECQGCERQGPFRINYDQSEFIDAQRLRVQESPEGLRGGETPQNIDVNIEDDITGEVTAGDHVSVSGILKLEQQGSDREKSAMFDIYMDGMTVEIEDEQFEEMDITDEDKKAIIELSNQHDIYEQMVGAIAPSIYGFETEKQAIIFQLFSGVTKHLPDDSRTRGDLHILLVGDPGTGKCLSGDQRVTLADGRRKQIGELVEENLDDPNPVDDGVYDSADIPVPSLTADGRITEKRATKVWKRDAPEEMYRLTTASGRTLEVTPSHPLFVQSDGTFEPRKAENLQEETFVAAPETIPTSATTSLEVESDSATERKAQAAEASDGITGNTNTDVVPEVGDLLRDIREKLALSQSECGVPRTTYQHYERGDRNPSKEALSTVLSAFEERVDCVAPDGGSVASAQSLTIERINQALDASEQIDRLRTVAEASVRWERIETIERIKPEYDWVYDLEVEGTHNYISEGLVSHNSQLLQYVKNIAPRSVYTSGKGSSAAGLTAAAVRDDFGDGQQWTLEAGALVLADQGIAAVDELDKMRPEDQSAMHQALEQQSYHPDTEVLLSDGRRVAIGELVDDRMAANPDEVRDGIDCELLPVDDIGVHTVNLERNEAWKTAVDRVSRHEAPEQFVRVEFSNGNEVVVTPEHPMFVHDQGTIETRKARDIEAGVFVPAPPELPDSPVAVDRVGSEADGRPGERVDPLSRRERPTRAPDGGSDRRSCRVTDVETVPNEGEYDCDWVYDVTVEPTNTFVSKGVVLHNSISISKAGINATLKSRCSLLGAANPTYGRFDEYEPIGEQIDLSPPLISRFDLIFTVTDQPDEEEDAELAEHILQTNYAGELNTHREQVTKPDYTAEQVDRVTEDVAPTIDPELLRKYVAFAKRNCYPTMTEEAKAEIRDYYVRLRSQGEGEESAIPVTARKLEALVRLSEASARVRLSDTVEQADAQRAIDIAQYCLEDIGRDPETGELDADMIETGTSKSQRDRIKNIKNLIASIEDEYDEGAPVDVVIERAEEQGMETTKAEHEIDKLKQKGEVYEPRTDHLRTT